MRTSIIAVTFIAATFTAVLASSAVAQQAAPPPNTFMSHKDIMALVDKATADRKGDAPIVAEPIVQLAPYKAQLEYRPGTSPAAFHEKDAELMVVRQCQQSQRLIDRVTHAVVKGDMIIIPANTPHQVIPTGGAPIVIMTMHVPYPSAGWPPAN